MDEYISLLYLARFSCKKGSKDLPGNYRPGSLTCILCKVMESVIRDSIVEHLTSKSLLRQSQHGFMRGKSTVTNLLEYLEEMTNAIDRGEDIYVLYLDFSKAFDKVPIRRLLSNCEGLGIKGKLLGWVEQLLTGRRQRVVLNRKESEWGPIKSGVVQGSVLGPCLFLIFINDIDQAVEGLVGMLKKFADDTKWGKKVMSEEERLAFQQGVNNLQWWSTEWQMPSNSDKCHVLHVGRTNPRLKYTMGQGALEQEQEKEVGVIISENCKPSLQCAKAAQKANAVLGQLSKGVSYRDKDCFMSLYQTYVRPHLEYAVAAWSPWNQEDKEILESLQRRTVKMVTNLKGRTYSQRLKELGMITLEERRERGDLIQAYKVLTGKEMVSHQTWFQMNTEEVDRRQTRDRGGILSVERKEGRLEIRQHFWSVRVANKWNMLPDMVKSAATVDNFKNRLDNWT